MIYFDRDQRFERSSASGKFTRSGASDALSTYEKSTSYTGDQIWTIVAYVTVVETRTDYANRIDILSTNYRQHTDGKSTLRHVQKLSIIMINYLIMTEFHFKKVFFFSFCNFKMYYASFLYRYN